jgi:VanZ family protein
MLRTFLDRRRAAALCLALGFAFLLIGWWPLDPTPRNQVAWLKDQSGLSFRPPGIAHTARNFSLPPAPPGEGFTIELHLEAGTEPRSNVNCIASFHEEGRPSGLILLQWKSELILRIPDPAAPRGFREVGVNALQLVPRVITVTCDDTGTNFYVDGRPARRLPKFIVPTRALRGRLVLGDAAEGKQGWTGRLYGFALHGRALNRGEVAARFHAWKDREPVALRESGGLAALYLFTEGAGLQTASRLPLAPPVEIPATYSVVEKSAFLFPRDFKAAMQAGRQDIIVNLLGFVPFGWLALLSFRPRPGAGRWAALVFAVLAGAGLSLIIEGGQIWLPNRVSSALDLVCNTLGTLGGALLALRMTGQKKER